MPIIYEVDRIRDGKSFTTRRVVAIQHGRAIFSLAASFQIEEEGLDHALDMPKVTPPDDLPSEAELRERFGAMMPENVRRWFDQERPIEMRPVDLKRYVGRDKPMRPGPARLAPRYRQAARRPRHPPAPCWPICPT